MAVAYAAAGRLPEAGQTLGLAATSRNLKAIDAAKIALLQAWYGLDAQYAATRERAITDAANTTDVNEASYTAKLACVRPIPDSSLQRTALTLARRAVEHLQTDSWVYLHQLGLGMAEYRNGLFDDARKTLVAAETGAASHPEGPCPAAVQTAARLYRVMALFRQGETTEAGKLLAGLASSARPADEKNPLVDGASYEDVIGWLALAEARSLLSANQAAANSPAR